jgi:hypothetical protein
MHESWRGPATIHEFWDEWFQQCPSNQYDLDLDRLTFLFHRHGIDKTCARRDKGVTTDIGLVDPIEIEPFVPEGADLASAIAIEANVVDETAEDPTDDAYTDITINVGELDVETCWVYKQGVGPLAYVELHEWPTLPTVKPPGVPVFSRNVDYNYVIIRLYVGDPLLAVIRDSFPPTTQLTIGEPQFVDATDTYVTSATPFTLTAEDPPDGSVGSTAYRIYNSAYDSGWLPYTHPFSLVGLSDGEYHVAYNSTDDAENVESTHTAIVMLDNTPPTIAIGSPIRDQEYRHSETLLIDFKVTDEWSGVTSVSAQLDGSPVNDDDLVDLLVLTLGPHTLMITGVDNLGHIADMSVTFTIIADVDSLIALVERFYESGQIDDLEVKDGLLDKLYAAQALIDAGKLGPARNLLRAFIRQVEAQRGHHITEEAAAILLADAEYALEHL